jgi:hypothetical protein
LSDTSSFYFILNIIHYSFFHCNFSLAQLLFNSFYTKVAADELDCPETEVASLAAGAVLSWWPPELGAGPPPARLAIFLVRPAY